MILLVCGDRDWFKELIMRKVIEELSPSQIIEGEARGADRMSRTIGDSLGIPVKRFPANWPQYGDSAGSIRNAKMLKEGKPDLVVAFHEDIGGSRGTGNMLSKAEDADIPYILIEGNFHCCLFCKSYITHMKECTLEEEVTDHHNQVCEHWRYIA